MYIIVKDKKTAKWTPMETHVTSTKRENEVLFLICGNTEQLVVPESDAFDNPDAALAAAKLRNKVQTLTNGDKIASDRLTS